MGSNSSSDLREEAVAVVGRVGGRGGGEIFDFRISPPPIFDLAEGLFDVCGGGDPGPWGAGGDEAKETELAAGGGGGEGGDAVRFGGDHGCGDDGGGSPGVEVGGLEFGDEAVEGAQGGRVGPADGGEPGDGGGDAGVGGEELGIAVAEGGELCEGEVGEEVREEVEGVGRCGGVEEVEDAWGGHEGDYTGSVVKWLSS